jgi:peptidoglycan/xylan/chitin deacetylase (PgdA/CDA1 family)
VSLLVSLVLAFSGTSGSLLWLALPVAVAAAGHHWMMDEGGVPVLVYHSVSANQSWLPWAPRIAVTPESYERHLRILRRLGCHVITTNELINARREAFPLPERPVVLHLDDGYLDNWVAALPLLKRHEMPATLFVSLDFIESGTEPRPNLEDVEALRCKPSDFEWSGYLNWAELRAMESSGVVDVQAHGVDHGRVVTGQGIVDTIKPENWRRHAWVQWTGMSGNKSEWFRHDEPPCVPYGSPVRQSKPALAARAWREGRIESEGEYESRVRSVLERSRSVLGEALDKEIRVFCWPQNATTPTARRIAEEIGYRATTGGRGENRLVEDARVISRIHVSDRVLGFHCPWLDSLSFLAQVRLGHGNYYWYLVLLPILVLSRVARFSRRGTGKNPG